MAAFNRRNEGLYLVEVALGIDWVVGECWDKAVAGIEVFNRLVTWAEFLNGKNILASPFSSRYDEKQRLQTLRAFKEGSLRVAAETCQLQRIGGSHINNRLLADGCRIVRWLQIEIMTEVGIVLRMSPNADHRQHHEYN